MKHKNLVLIIISVLLINGCSQRVAPTSTQMPIATLRAETVVINTPTVSPTTTPKIEFLTTQCLDIQPSIPDNFKSADNIVLKDYSNNKLFFGLQHISDDSGASIVGKEVLYPFLSPNRKLLTYLDIVDANEPKLILVNIKNEIQATIPWLDEWGLFVGWINDYQLTISPYGQEQIIIFNPFTGNAKTIAFDQFPDFNFILNFPWANYDTTLSRVIYPGGGGSVLFDTESQKVLAEIPTGDQLQSADVSWKMDGASATVIGSIFPFTEKESEELFIVTRDGIVEQLTNLANYYGNVVLSSPRWSPDGKHIAFWETDSLNKYQDRKLLIIDVDTKQITNYCISTYHDMYGNFGEVLPAPIWSPDGTQILVENRYSEDHNNIILIDISRNIAVQIAQDARPIGWMTPP